MKKSSIEFNGLLSGAFVFIGLVAYFLIMKALGLEHNFELRALNLLIMAGGVFYAIRSTRKYHPDFDYLKGLGAGVITAISSTIAFAIFVFFYLVGNPEFLTSIIENEPFGSYLNKFTITAVIIIEGLFSGFMLSFVIMQWYKKGGTESHLEK